MSIKEELNDLLEYLIDDVPEDDEVDKLLEPYFTSKNIEYTWSLDLIYDSCGRDAYSFSVAWIEDNKPKLSVCNILSC